MKWTKRRKPFDSTPAASSSAMAAKLTVLYITALTTVAILTIAGQVIVQNALRQQENDSRVVNIAGRQRMLSQKLSKEVKMLETSDLSKEIYVELLEETVELWEQSHDGLLHGDRAVGLPGTNSAEVLKMYEMIEVNYDLMLQSAKNILHAYHEDGVGDLLERTVETSARTILKEEPYFLRGMDAIVFQYDKEATGRVETFKSIEQALLATTLFVLLLEGLFIFRPAVRKLTFTIGKRKRAEARMIKLAAELEKKNRQLNEACKEILDISEQERRRVALDLHDGLGQEISGITCVSKALYKKLKGRDRSAASDARVISSFSDQAMRHARRLARGMYPTTVDSEGLPTCLSDMLSNTEKLYNVSCRFEADPLLPRHDDHAATQLFQIAQEAVRNSIKHGEANEINVQLRHEEGRTRLSVRDNGSGFQPLNRRHEGLGLRIMQYRAELIGAHLNILSDIGQGTALTCTLDNPGGF